MQHTPCVDLLKCLNHIYGNNRLEFHLIQHESLTINKITGTTYLNIGKYENVAKSPVTTTKEHRNHCTPKVLQMEIHQSLVSTVLTGNFPSVPKFRKNCFTSA